MFLVRDPREVLLSYLRSMEEVNLHGIGFQQQAELYYWLIDHGHPAPLVIDSRDFFRNPHKNLIKICDYIGGEFRDGMLSRLAGPRATDGAWEPHWYASLEASTGFAPWRESTGKLSPEQTAIEHAARPFYDRLCGHCWQSAD